MKEGEKIKVKALRRTQRPLSSSQALANKEELQFHGSKEEGGSRQGLSCFGLLVLWATR